MSLQACLRCAKDIGGWGLTAYRVTNSPKRQLFLHPHIVAVMNPFQSQALLISTINSFLYICFRCCCCCCAFAYNEVHSMLSLLLWPTPIFLGMLLFNTAGPPPPALSPPSQTASALGIARIVKLACDQCPTFNVEKAKEKIKKTTTPATIRVIAISNAIATFTLAWQYCSSGRSSNGTTSARTAAETTVGSVRMPGVHLPYERRLAALFLVYFIYFHYKNFSLYFI